LFGGEALSVRPIVSPLRSEGKIEAVIAELGRELGDGFMHRKPIAAAV
jgi:hypothetical protein